MEINHLPLSPEDRYDDPFLERIDRRLERRERGMRTNLMAWSEVLDALGWCVATRVPGEPPTLSTNAIEWAARQESHPMDWTDFVARLEEAPNLEFLLASEEIQVWQEVQADPAANPSASLRLSKRETEVLGWLRAGKTAPETAIILGCSRRTVESHAARIYRKLGVRSRSGLIFQSPTPLAGDQPNR